MGTRLAIIGAAGVVGSAAAFRLADRESVSEVIMIDVREKLAQSHAVDIEQALFEKGRTDVRFGSWRDLEGCDIVIMAAAAPVGETSVENRIASNAWIVREAASQIGRYCPKAVVITLTNPMDVFNYALYSLSGLQAHQFVGFSWNDTHRFRYAVAKLLKEPLSDIEAIVLGQHGPAKVHLFDRVTLRSKPVRFTAEQEEELGRSMRDWFSAFVSYSGDARTTGWTCAVGIPEIVEAIVNESDRVFQCSTILKGEYGLSDVSVGVPVRLGLSGVREIVELSLTKVQSDALKEAAKAIQGLVSIFSGQ